MRRRVLPSCRLEAALSNHLFPHIPHTGQYEISVGSDKLFFDYVEEHNCIEFFQQLFNENEKQHKSETTKSDNLLLENKYNYYFEHTPSSNFAPNLLPSLDQIDTMVMSRGRRKKSEMDSTGGKAQSMKKKSPDSTKLRRNSKKFETSGSEAEDSDIDIKPSQAYFDSEESNEDADDQNKKKGKRMIKRRKKEKDDSQSDTSDREKITIIKNRSKIFEFIQTNIIDWSAKQEKSFPGMKKKMLDNFFQGSNDAQISPSDSKLSIKVEEGLSSPALKSETGSNEPSPTENSGKKRRSLKLKKKEYADDEEQHAPEGNISDFNFLNSLTSPTGGSTTVGEPDSASSNTNSIMSLKIPRKKKQPATIVSESATADQSNSNSLLDNSPISNTPSSTLPPSTVTPHSATGVSSSSSFASPNVVAALAPPPPPQQPPPPLLPPSSTTSINTTSILLPSQSSQQQGAPSFLPPNANILPNVYGSSSSTSNTNYPTLHLQQNMPYHMHPHQSTHNLPPPPPPHGYPSHQSIGPLPPYGATSHGQNWQPHLPYINAQQQQQQPQPPSYPPVQDPRRR